MEVEVVGEHREAEARQGEAREEDLVAGQEVSAEIQEVAVASAVEVEEHREAVVEDNRPMGTVRMAYGVHGAGECLRSRCVTID